MAAGLLLVAEAGGISADLMTRPATLTSTATILSNAALGESFIELIRHAGTWSCSVLELKLTASDGRLRL